MACAIDDDGDTINATPSQQQQQQQHTDVSVTCFADLQEVFEGNKAGAVVQLLTCLVSDTLTHMHRRMPCTASPIGMHVVWHHFDASVTALSFEATAQAYTQRRDQLLGEEAELQALVEQLQGDNDSKVVGGGGAGGGAGASTASAAATGSNEEGEEDVVTVADAVARALAAIQAERAEVEELLASAISEDGDRLIDTIVSPATIHARCTPPCPPSLTHTVWLLLPQVAAIQLHSLGGGQEFDMIDFEASSGACEVQTRWALAINVNGTAVVGFPLTLHADCVLSNCVGGHRVGAATHTLKPHVVHK